jgi:hypothetical protein
MANQNNDSLTEALGISDERFQVLKKTAIKQMSTSTTIDTVLKFGIEGYLLNEDDTACATISELVFFAYLIGKMNADGKVATGLLSEIFEDALKDFIKNMNK